MTRRIALFAAFVLLVVLGAWLFRGREGPPLASTATDGPAGPLAAVAIETPPLRSAREPTSAAVRVPGEATAPAADAPRRQLEAGRGTLSLTLVFAGFPIDSLPFVVGREGGRSGYRPVLQRMFPEMELAIVREDDTLSSYELSGQGKFLRIHFPVGAELKCLPVAMASMLSKYVREVLNESMNRFFCDQCRDLRPTAGYWQDGRRFIQDLKIRRPDFPWKTELLIRSR